MTNVMSAMTMMVVLILMLQLHEAKAATYIVGDQRGWTIPPYDNYYKTWASKHRVIKVNDILVFKFEYGKQNWAWVERHDYNVCNTTAVPVVASKYTIVLRVLTPTTFHFMCTFPGHCSRGQKMSLTVVCA
ncbi:hypothetical protein FF1_017576 [Malus domestica]